jgi:hypothetical protein
MYYSWNSLNTKVMLQNDVILNVLVVVTVKVAAFWGVKHCFLLDTHPRFGKNVLPHHPP